MTTLIESILIGFGNFPFFAVLFTLPIIVGSIVRYKSWNLVRVGFNYLFLLYMLCVIALVLFPLPTVEQAALLHTHRVQWIPFRFVADIMKESPLQWNNPRTYAAAIFQKAVLQVVFNVFMTVPFGMYLNYNCGLSKRRTIFCAFILSACIELTQLTGIFGIYHGSYRLCDVDDLMANTLGGFLGYQMITYMRRFLPNLNRYNHCLPSVLHNYMKVTVQPKKSKKEILQARL